MVGTTIVELTDVSGSIAIDSVLDEAYTGTAMMNANVDNAWFFRYNETRFPGEEVHGYAVQIIEGYIYAPDRLRRGSIAEPETDV